MNPEELSWLPPVAEDFRARTKALALSRTADALEVRALSTSRLGLNQLHLLAGAIERSPGLAATPRLGVSILSNATADFIAPALVATAPRHDLWLSVRVAPFGVVAQQCLDPQSETNRRRDAFVLLALDHRGLALTPCVGDESRAATMVATVVDDLMRWADALYRASGATVIVQTIAPPPELLLGSLDGAAPGTMRWLVEHFNASLRQRRSAGTLLLDAAALAASVGLVHWHDAMQWNLGKFAFAQRMLPIYADWICRLVAASLGKSKKCLVLDLDNTLWGGVIGDDGLHGIVLGQGSPVGEAHLAVQATALALRERGIVLAVSSKNDEAIARSAFREHPDMLIREEHIAVFQANWQDKASNLRIIAETLDIGIDALVLLDDNPAERAQVRAALPQVGVPEMPADPEHFAGTLLAAGYFEAALFTSEDRDRAAMYQANASRSVALRDATDLEGYLASLAMEARFDAFNETSRARITQLINKTNQFNLTTRRYAEAEVAQIENDPERFGLQVRLVDRFGDNGMISVVACSRGGDAWIIDLWLMSCRVLNRRLEEQVLDIVVAAAVSRGIRRLEGRYLPTPKNDLVRDHYARLGFDRVCSDDRGSVWTLDVASHRSRMLPFKVIRSSSLGAAESA